MNVRLFSFLVLGVMLMAAAGCAKVKFYAVDRPRVDQANMGNAGYVAGEKKSDGSISERQTRRIYVFEIDRKKKEQAVSDTTTKTETTEVVAKTETEAEPLNAPKQGLSLPYIGDDEPTADQSAAASSIDINGTLYTVLKDDTLQKISKKVYGVYSKWTKIYDANKDKIKNPNFVKPGTVILIPPLD